MLSKKQLTSTAFHNAIQDLKDKHITLFIILFTIKISYKIDFGIIFRDTPKALVHPYGNLDYYNLDFTVIHIITKNTALTN